ncbi:hypothetical protein ACFFKJ_26980 [Pelagicoccus mobilis]
MQSSVDSTYRKRESDGFVEPHTPDADVPQYSTSLTITIETKGLFLAAMRGRFPAERAKVEFDQHQSPFRVSKNGLILSIPL